jgi:hypothetical protein
VPELDLGPGLGAADGRRGKAEGGGPGQQGTALHGVISPIVDWCGGW